MVSGNKKLFYKIEEIIDNLKKGKLVIIVDDQSEKNDGVLFQPAETATIESVVFFINQGKGLIYLACEPGRLETLGIPSMDFLNTLQGTARSKGKKSCFPSNSVSFDSSHKRGTGASARDKLMAIKAFIDPKSKPADFSIPGHIFPFKYHDGGVLARAGHFEAAVDLSRISGFYPAGIICEIIREDGEIARLKDLFELSRKYNLKIVTIEELIRFRKRKEKLIEKVSEIILPTKWGDFKALTYRSLIAPETHIALIKGDIKGKNDVPVRVHSQCLTGDTFGSKRCDCGEQLESAFILINKKGYGVLLYMAQEGRGIGLCNKMKAYELQDRGYDTVEANILLGFEPDMRDYGIGAQILADLGLSKIQLITNNPRKIIGLEGYGIKITQTLPIIIKPNENNRRYLQTKKTKLKHLLE